MYMKPSMCLPLVLLVAIFKGTNYVGVFLPFPQDGITISFRNIVISNYLDRYTHSINPVNLSVIHHRENLLDSTKIIGLMNFRALGYLCTIG
jgi:hypothetical protein